MPGKRAPDPAFKEKRRRTLPMSWRRATSEIILLEQVVVVGKEGKEPSVRVERRERGGHGGQQASSFLSRLVRC
jgi:hypothetical protein